MFERTQQRQGQSNMEWAKRIGRAVVLFSAACAAIVLGLHQYHSGRAPLPAPAPGALRVATMNVHYIVLSRETGPWSVSDWNARKGALSDAFGALEADLVGFQEMESFGGGSGGSVNLAADHLLAQHPDYAAAATGDYRSFPTTQPIFYRRDRLRLVDQGWFFFSETPDEIYSRTFNGSWPAFASWAEFEPLDGGPVFRAVNVHFEYRSRSNRRLSAALVRDRIAPVIASGTPVILLGDLNAWHGTRTQRILAETGLVFAPVRGATYHFDRGLNLFGPIDHLAATPEVDLIAGPVVLREKFDGMWPTDHYPVIADYRLPD